MAIILGQKLVKDTETYNDYAIGITLPIQITNVAFNQSFTTREQVRSNIINLLKTKRGERIMQPEFGIGLESILFESIDEDTQIRIQREIETTISLWLPYVVIEDLIVNISDELRDRNTIDISLSFSIVDNAELETVTFTI
jgi:phage baseplate assembly protein W